MSARPIVATFAIALLLFAAARANADEITGTIKSVDLDRGRFVVTVGDEDTVLSVTSSTSFERDGRNARRGDVLQVGNRVTVDFSGSTADRVNLIG